jgi:hypothetical protein
MYVGLMADTYSMSLLAVNGKRGGRAVISLGSLELYHHPLKATQMRLGITSSRMGFVGDDRQRCKMEETQDVACFFMVVFAKGIVHQSANTTRLI